MSKRVLVTGANGQLGGSIKAISECYPSLDFIYAGKRDLDLSGDLNLGTYLLENQIDIIINCGAYTGVDAAESNKFMAEQINALGVQRLAVEARMQGLFLVHISTDYVFSGHKSKPYLEEDSVSPLNAYGLTKLRGEQAFINENPAGFIVRTSWLYSEFGNNFVKTMLEVAKVNEELAIIYDQVGTPTYAHDLAVIILEVISNDRRLNKVKELGQGEKVFHFSNEGICSWYDFAKAIFELENIDCKVKPIESSDYEVQAVRPYYSVLNKNKIKQTFDLEIPYWRDSLNCCLNKLRDEKYDG